APSASSERPSAGRGRRRTRWSRARPRGGRTIRSPPRPRGARRPRRSRPGAACPSAGSSRRTAAGGRVAPRRRGRRRRRPPELLPRAAAALVEALPRVGEGGACPLLVDALALGEAAGGEQRGGALLARGELAQPLLGDGGVLVVADSVLE